MPVRKRKKGTISTLVLTVFGIGFVVLLAAMVANKNTLEYRVILKSTDIIGTRAAFDMLNLSLTTGWKAMAENTLLLNLENNFGNNVGYTGYYGWAAPGNLMFSPIFSCNKGVCLPGLKDVYNNLTTNISNSAARIPTALSMEYQNSNKDVRISWNSISFSPSLDRTTLRLLQHVEILGTDTRISVSYPMEINIVPRLSRMILSSFLLVGGMTQARWSMENTPITNRYLQSLREATLEKVNENIAKAVESANKVADYGDIDISQRWYVQNGDLMLMYTGSGKVVDGREGLISGLVKCDETNYVKEREFFYNTWAGAFEFANIDRLLPYVESPGALVGAIAEKDGWHKAKILFGNYTDENRDTHRIVRESIDKLISSMRKASETNSDNHTITKGLALFHAGFPLITSTTASDDAWAQEVKNIYEQWRHLIIGGDGKRTCMFGEDDAINNPGNGWGIGWPLKGDARSRQIISCYGDSSCSGKVPVGSFNHGIDISAGSVEQGEAVYAAADGIIQRVGTDNSPNGIGTYVMIIHMDPAGNYYSTVYGYLRSVTYPWQNNRRITKGTQIGFSGLKSTEDGSIPALHFRVITNDYSFNPCIWLGCIPDTPYASASNVVLPTIKPITNPYDYANFLKVVNGKFFGSTITNVRIGDDFCSPDGNLFSGKKLAYNFYGDVGEGATTAWVVTPAYGGVVVRIENNWFGCYGAVWVKTGDFIISYGHIMPASNLQIGNIVIPGDSIGNVIKITGTETFPKICREPPLEVRIFRTSFVLPEEDGSGNYNACGSKMNCHESIINYQNPDGSFQDWSSGSVCDYTQEGCFPTRTHCASIEWNSLFKPKFTGMWQYMPARRSFEPVGATLLLNLSDSMKIIDCTLNNNKRFRWLYENDSACIDEGFVICSKDSKEAGIDDAQVIKDGQSAGNGTYYCVSRNAGNTDEFYLPDISQSVGIETANNYLNYLGSRQLSRLCTSNETNVNWLCCLGSAPHMTLYCEPHSWIIDGDDLNCGSGGICRTFETGA